ncbi:carboxypeptidase A1-like [Chiloscyllium plagiosum]|uniref:carboxypeptidase A1-like n=1 Tax=Chiloscyllium plagiosum TaxID=36176 RepID=UPI001CB81366|nr:carboxypeptidase A1-like [Chiloscyllium plagiosum]
MRGLWLFHSIVLVVAHSRVTFVGDQVLRFRVNSQEQLAMVKFLAELDNLKLDFWKEPVSISLPIELRVPRKHVHTVKSFLESNGITYSVMIKNLQPLVDEQHMSMLGSDLGRNGTDSFNYGNYHKLKEIFTWLKDLAAENPQLVRRIKIGRSSQGRALHVLKFSTGRNRPAIWIDSGIHGRERVAPAVAIWIAKKITTDYGIDPSITSLLNKMDIFMEIMANPDGYVYSWTTNPMWRKTMSKSPGTHCFGVDANRNFDTNFGGNGSSKAPCAESYCGPHAHSEPEVKAIVNFIKNHGNFMVFITLHSYFQRLLYPYGRTHMPPENFEELATLASEAIEALTSLYGTQYTHGSIVQAIGESSGNSIDWSYDQGIKYAYAFELRDEGQYGFKLPPNQIVPTAEETWLAIKKIMEHASNVLP